MQNITMAVDLAKSVFEVAVSERPGTVSERHRLSRRKFLDFLVQRKPAVVLLEACGSAHFWGRKAAELGHQPVLLPPREVRRYVRRNKTDRADAKALLEAHRNEEILPVPVKSVPQQSLMALHRFRSGWMAARTGQLNSIRGLLREFGILIPLGARQVVPHVEQLIEDAESDVPMALRAALAGACSQVRELEDSIRSVEKELQQLARQTPLVAQLQTIPGIGILTATALVAFVGDIRRFPSARHFASYLGLTPSERSSAYRRRLGKISKRGDVYLRMLLTHGARAVLHHAKRTETPDRLRAWATRVERFRGHNKATMALANKLARIVWAVWTKGQTYQSIAPAA